MDHYGIDAFIDYWDHTVITPELDAVIRKNGRAMMYMDSMELTTFAKGGNLWGFTFLDEFKKRRGYDLTPYLPLIIKTPGFFPVDFEYTYACDDSAESRLFAEKLHNDVYQTMTDCYMYNMMKPMQDWCHKHGMELRSEISYGLPFEISQPGKFVDDVETESLEFASQIESYRGMAGSAHVYNRVYSSETGATRMNYTKPLSFYNQMIYTQFAAGVSRTVLHGYSSIAGSEASTYWPGHEGMWPVFSERFGVRQPAFRHYNDWTGMLARYQLFLRDGKPRMDIAMLRTDYNYNNLFHERPGVKEIDTYEKCYMRAHQGVYWNDMSLQDAGYTWDYFAPQLLEEDFVDYRNGELIPEGPGYRALIVYQDALPPASAKKILALAKKGLPVLFVNGVKEMTRPEIYKTYQKAACQTPFNDNKDAELNDIVAEIKKIPNVREVNRQADAIDALKELRLEPRAAFNAPCTKILTMLRQHDDAVYLFVYNMMYTDKEPCTFSMALEGEGEVYRIDCWNAEVWQTASEAKNDATLILTPYSVISQ
jgi:hypothetical protein